MNTTPEDIIEKAINLADHYHGTEADFNTFFETLFSLETMISGVPGQRTTDEKEQAFTRQHYDPDRHPYDPDQQPLTISGLIDRSDRALSEAEEKIESGDLEAISAAEDAGIVVMPVQPFVFVRPEVQEIQTGNSDGEFDDPKFGDRVRAVKLFVVSNDFAGRRAHRDQVIEYPGIVTKEQMREVPYHILHIIPWGLTIAVCDQVGEAMFFMGRPLDEFGLADWAEYGKTALQEDHGAVKIIMSADWREKLLEVLTAHLNQETFVPKTRKEIDEAKKLAREGRITITPTMRANFKAEMERTGIGTYTIPNVMGDSWPQTFEPLSRIRIWFQASNETKSGYATNTCDPQVYNIVLNFLKDRPDEFRVDEIDIPYRLDRRELFKLEMYRTGLRPKALRNAMGSSWPQDFNPKNLESYFTPSSKTRSGYNTNTCDRQVWDCLYDFLRNQLGEFRLDVVEVGQTLTRREILRVQMDRTGFGPKALYNAMDNSWPQGFNPKSLDSCLRPNIKTKSGYTVNTCDREIYHKLLGFLKSQPDGVPRRRRDRTPTP